MSNTGSTKLIAYLLSIAAPMALFSATPLNPGSPVLITNATNLESQVTVCSSNGGFLAAWTNFSGGIATSLSNDNGSTWTATGSVPGSPYADNNVRICSGPLGSVVGWGATTVVGFNYTPAVSFSSDNGSTWSTSISLDTNPADNMAADLPVVANDQGFMATFTNYTPGAGGYNAYASFSANGTTWSSMTQINTVLNSVATYSTTVACLGHVFLAAWLDNSSLAQTSISTDMGSTWSAPVSIPAPTPVNSEVSLCATNTGFLAAWIDSSGNVYSSFSSNNGASWTTNTTPIATGATGLAVGLGSSSEGVVATWEDTASPYTTYASFTSNNGSTWLPQAQVATDVGSPGGILGVSLNGRNCVLTWTDSSSSDGYSSYIQLPETTNIGTRFYARPSNRRH